MIYKEYYLDSNKNIEDIIIGYLKIYIKKYNINRG